MPENELPLAPPVRDLADETFARRSLRASVERRATAIRRRRRTRGGRSAAIVAAATLALGSAGAMAQSTGGVSGSSSSASSASSSAGYDVKAVQTKLGVVADGVFGAQSRKALRRFQRAHGLVADGIIGPATLRALGMGSATAAPRASAAGTTTVSAQLAAIAQCESGGDPTAVSRSGTYRGKYQFSRSTWRSLGGTGDPAAAPESEQDLRAAALMQRQGPSAWPVCSKQAS